jgi:MarR family transcriptional regulator, organic hydroperoxide resistance regulator
LSVPAEIYRNPAHEATLALLRCEALLARRLDSLFDGFGLGLQQFNVLRILRGAGGQGIPTLAVASRLIHQTPGITRLFDRLETKQLVRRVRCPEDRRQVLCWITPQGLDLLDQIDPPLDRLQQEFFAGLDAASLRQLTDLVTRVRAQNTKGETE